MTGLVYGALWVSLAAVFILAGRGAFVPTKPAEPEQVQEVIPGWLWRANLDAALDDMTLQSPRIDYELVNSWQSYADAKRAKQLSSPSYNLGPQPQRELIRKALRGSVYHAESGNPEVVPVHAWGQKEPVREVGYSKQRAIVIDTDEMVAAESMDEFARAASRSIVQPSDHRRVLNRLG